MSSLFVFVRPTVLLVLVLCTWASPRPGLAQSDLGAPDPGAALLPPEKQEVQGTCLTPRQAYLQVLYWAKSSPSKAALCFDTSSLTAPAEQAPELAERMLEYLDAEALYIDVDAAPADPGYVDPSSGQQQYFDPLAPQFRIRRYPDGRWLFTPESLGRIPEASVLKNLSLRLPEWFRSRFLGNEIWKYLGVIILIFLALALQRMVVFFVRNYLRRLVSRANLSYLDKAIGRADRPIGGLAMALVFHLGLPKLAFTIGFMKVALVATKALAAFSVVWLSYRLIDVLAIWLAAKASKSDTKLDDQLVPLVTKSLKVFVSVIGGIFVLQNLDVNVGSLLAGVGLGGLAFALAAKDTVANFFGSVMIFIDKPFQIGDWVVIGSVEGTVEEVGFRTTRIRTFYSSLVTVPNAQITSTSIDNYGLRQYRRYSTTLGLCYDTPVAKVQAFCTAVRALIARMPGMRKDYYLVELKGFGESSLDVMLYCFMIAPNWNEEMRIRTHLNLEILRIAEELGVSFAFPTRTLHVDSLVPHGQSKPSHAGPKDEQDLAAVVTGFGPDGALGRTRGLPLGPSYDCGPEWPQTPWGSSG